jgi:hypothetical protein
VLVLLAAACGPEKLATGDACSVGAECASGFCVGFGCDGAGVCVDPAAEEECGPDADSPGFVPACTCDGEQLERVRPLCPTDPIAFYGSCDYHPEPGNGEPESL